MDDRSAKYKAPRRRMGGKIGASRQARADVEFDLGWSIGGAAGAGAGMLAALILGWEIESGALWGAVIGGGVVGILMWKFR